MRGGALPARGQGGFTLVEVIVSLGILSLIMLATISALRTFGQTQVSLDKMIDRVDEVRTVSGMVRGAADALSRHMTGLMQSVQSVLASAKVYGRRGRLVSSGQNQYCVDVKS